MPGSFPRIAVVLLFLSLGLCAAAAASSEFALRGSVDIEAVTLPVPGLPGPQEAAPAATAGGPAPTMIPLLPGMPMIGLRTLLVGLHLIGLSLGLGGVIVLDILLFRAVVRGHFRAHNRSLVWILSKTTSTGLSLLWASGLAVLLLYAHDNPALLSNQKIWAKVVIVAVLTVNGWFIHRVCLPHLVGDRDAPLFAETSRTLRKLMLFGGSLSAVSWYAAALLGTVRELNGAVSAVSILAAWAAGVALAYGATLVGWQYLHRKNVQDSLSREESLPSSGDLPMLKRSVFAGG